jgi:regulator of sigma E protease
VDIGLILAATTGEPGLASWLMWRAIALLGVAAGLTFVIFVHELGHFLVAKACGVKCEKFYVGFDFFEFRIPFTNWKIPRSLFKVQWGETEYGIGSLPLGGYVKMLGQDDDPRNAETEAARIHSEAVAHPGETPTKPEEAPVAAQTVEGKTVLLDPRSYPAKSVPARMAIISAGVIMNLIFGVILAAVAFAGGVRELPATIGGVTPGSPAWTVGIVPGSKILQVGRRGNPYEYLRFEDLTTSVILNGYDRDLPILIRRPDGQVVWYEVRPSDRLKPLTRRPTLGVTHERSNKIGVPTSPDAYLHPATTPPLEDKDIVVAIDGQKIAANGDIVALLARRPSGTVTLTVVRGGDEDGSSTAKKQPETLTVSVPPLPMRGIGAAMQIGPIVAVRKGSPAEEAGIQVKDLIVEVNGESIGDPLSLPQRLVPQSSPPEPIKVVVSRTDRQGVESKRTLTVTPEPPLQFNDDYFHGGPVAIESIGVAYNVTHTVAAVDADGPAAAAGLAPGDVITQAEFLPANEKQRKRERRIMPSEDFKPITIDDNLKSWTYVFTRLQRSLPDTKIKLTWTRDGKEQSAVLDDVESTTFFDESRGLAFYGDSRIRRSTSLGESLRLGLRETSERLREVVLILHSLVTGRISPTNLSGAPGIIFAAASFASEGPSKLLMFLTMLSANLAVLNFLPIPALDGGHMLFLAAEGVRGKPVDERLQIRLTIAGVICLLSLMVFATAMDIGRFAEMIQEWFG